MAPADEVFIFTAPCLRLIQGIADDASRAEFIDSQFLHCAGLCRRQHHLATHIFSGVVVFCRTVAYINQVGSHIRALTVLGQTYRDGLIAGHQHRRLPLLAFFLHLP